MPVATSPPSFNIVSTITERKSSSKAFPLRGGPFDILGGGGVRSKKKFMQEIELEKNSCMRLKKEKNFVQLHEIV